ncbi:hypothetical protein [Propionivibrio sp.]|uniref:hypothetical protein n=1 Tax=Propionivibrio sp. TaxID=2212460 RepID=UPI002619B868|nr:hypothetical protein [Propionivibrio sp.]
MRHIFIVLWMLFFAATPTLAQVSVNIGINMSSYPELVRVPGYPVYYAPRQNSNFFFYDGMYWVYQNDNWYASSWYNGPWRFVDPEMVPLFVLRIPVRYYRNPPTYFYGWRREAPPHWGDHWGNDWVQHRRGWDQWNRRSAPAPAPLPVYQRKYSGERYPQAEQQHDIHQQNYRYQPRDAMVRQHDQAPTVQRAPASSRQSREAPPERNQQSQQDGQRAAPPSHPPSAPAAPRSQPPQQRGEEAQRSAPAREQQRTPAAREQQQPRQAPVQHEQPAPKQEQHGAPHDPGRGQGQDQEKDHDQGEGHGQGRNK